MTTVKKRKKTAKPSDGLDLLESGRIVPIGESSEWVSLVIYGRSGTGKTTFIGTMPKPLLVLDINDRGTVSIKAQPDTYVMEVTSWDEIEEVYWYLQSGNHPFQSVALDTVTQLQDLAIAKISGDDGGVMSLSRRGWGEVTGLMRTWILNYRDLPLHKGFICQDRITGDDSDELEMITPEVGPAVSPSVAKTLTAAVDVVGHTLIRERVVTVKTKKGGTKEKVVTEYCMRIGPHARYLTKIRREHIDKPLPQVVVNPTFDKITKLMKGEDIE